MVPTIALMAGLDRAVTHHTVGGKKLHANPAALRAARYTAVFSEDVLKTLPEEEATRLRTGNVGDWDVASRLTPLAMEGTTPASPVLYLPDAEKRAQHASEAAKDGKAFAQAAPNVGRSLKVLHVGGRHSADPHRFYHDIVELSLHASHPLYTDQEVRRLGAGASQFVFARTGKTAVMEAGATPRQLVSNDYLAVPLYSVDETAGKVLDYAATCSKQDVVPPRAGAMALSPAQSRDIKKSLDALKSLDASLSKDQVTGHCIAYSLAFSSLVNNPAAVAHFCSRIKDSAIAGIIDFRMVEDLALHEDGSQAGHFIMVNCVFRV
jgi:hypothetical protein